MNPKILIFLLVLPFHLLAQTHKLDLEKIVDGSLQPQALAQLQWRGSTDFFTYVENNQLVQDGVDTTKTVLFSLTDLNQKLSAFSVGLPDFPEILWKNDSVLSFWVKERLFEYDVNHISLKDIALLEKGAKNMEVSEKGAVAYTIGAHLWIYHHGGNHPISEDANHNISYGKAAYRQEFGIKKGLFWSPTGEKLAYYRIDQTEVTDYPIVDYSSIPAQYRMIKYPMAGQSSEVTTIGIYDIESGKNLYLKTGKPADQYLTNISWSPDGARIYVVIVNRGQNKMMLNEYRASDGEFVQTLFEEEHEKYIEPEHGMIFLPNKKGQFLWLSDRDGYKHLYLYQKNGNLSRQLTSGPWEVTDFMGFNEAGTRAFYLATEASPLERHIYSVGLMGLPIVDKPKRITFENGVHISLLNFKGNQILDTYSNRLIPLATNLIRATNGKPLIRLWEAANPLQDYVRGHIDITSMRADDGSKLYCRTIFPANFDSTKNYPAILYVYGGPHIQLIDESWLGDSRDLLFLHYLAANGYVVFSLDNRGSANRGQDFEQAIYRKMGTLEVEDQMKGVNYLKHLSWVDNNRIGVYGGSYGGFMTISLMLKQAKHFKAGVARGPVTDWKYYEAMYTERYMDTPKENPGGYLEAAVHNHIGKLKGNLLIIHGMQDSTVVPQHILSFMQAAVNQRVDVDFFPYPQQAHSVKGKDRIDFYRRVFGYFEEKLKGSN